MINTILRKSFKLFWRVMIVSLYSFRTPPLTEFGIRISGTPNTNGLAPVFGWGLDMTPLTRSGTPNAARILPILGT